MTKDTKTFPIESQIGRNVADYIFKEASHHMVYAKEGINSHEELFIRKATLEKICNQPPPIEKEMTAAELVEKLKEWCDKPALSASENRRYQGENPSYRLFQYAESLLKQNSEGKES